MNTDFTVLVVNALNGSIAHEAKNRWPDAIVGNPPYQEMNESGARKDQSSNLWTKFWVKSFNIIKHGGTIALVTPTSWMSPSVNLSGSEKIRGHKRLWDVFNEYDTLATVTDVDSHFPGVGSSFGYVIVNTQKNSGLRFSDPEQTRVATKFGFLPRSGYDRVEAELDTQNNLGNNFKIDQANNPDLRVSVPMSRSLTSESVEILQGQTTPQYGSDNPNLYLYVYVNTDEQANNVRQRIIDSLDVLSQHCRWSGFMNIKTLKLVKFHDN